MGLFNFFSKKNANGNGHMNGGEATVDIPEDVFIEKDKPKVDHVEASETLLVSDRGIKALYGFLDKNFEGRGYDDALTNPDSSHMQQNIELIKGELIRTIHKVKTFYTDFIKEIELHIATRSKNGLVDIVQELNTKKDIAEDHLNQVLVIEKDAQSNGGDGAGVILSYTRGFKNGLAAITHHSILKKSF